MPKVVVELGANTAGLTRGLNTLSGRLNGVMRGIGGMLKAIGPQLAAAVSFGALVKFTTQTARAADEAGKLAQRAGMAVEKFSAWQHAANLANVSNEELIKGSQKLGEWLAKNGQANVDLSDALLEQADLIAAMPDGMEKLRIVRQRFGEEGTKLIPLLNAGSKALKSQMEEAERLGIVFDQDAADSAAKFNDNLTRLKATLAGLRNQVILPMLPLLNELSDAFASLFGPGGAIDMREIGATFETLTRFVRRMREGDNPVAAARGAVMDGAFEAIMDTRRSSTPTGPVADPNAGVDAVTNMRMMLAQIRAAQEGAEGPDLAAQLRNEIAALNKIRDELRTRFDRQYTDDSFTRFTEGFSEVADEWNQVATAIGKAEEKLKSMQVLETTFASRMKENLQTLHAQWSTFGANVADILDRNVRGAVDNLADAMWAVADGALTWGDYFRQAARGVISDIVKVSLQWISSRLMRSATEQAASTAETAAKAPSALLTSISSYGTAALIGGAAFAAAMALTGGFATGGVIPAGERLIRVNEAGQEGVVNARGMANIGASGLAAINSGLVNAMNLASAIPAGIAAQMPQGGSGGSTTANAGAATGHGPLNIFLVDSRATAEQWAASIEGEARIIDVVLKNRTEIGIRT